MKVCVNLPRVAIADHAPPPRLGRRWLAAGLLAGLAGAAPAAAPHMAGVPTLGAHTLLWQPEGNGVNPAVTAPLTTDAQGSSFLVFEAGYRSNTRPPVDSKANTWTRVGQPVVFDGYAGRFDVKAWVALDGRGGADHTVTLDKTGPADGEISLPFIEIRNAGVLQDVAQNYPTFAPSLLQTLGHALWPFGEAPAAGGREHGTRHLGDPFHVQQTSASVTTTGPATLIALWFGDAYVLDMTAVPGNGFTVIDGLLHLPPESAVQCAVAYRNVSEAGTYHVTWTQSPNQGAVLWLLAFQSAAPAH